MTRQPLQSSTLRSAGYDVKASVLELEFISGSVYQYAGVPQDIYLGLMSAPSHGTYFNLHIKDRFPFVRVYGEVMVPVRNGPSARRP